MSICDVISRCAEKEVIRLDTSRPITMMTDDHIFGDWTNVQLVGYSMCSFDLLSNVELPVTFIR